MTNFIWIKNKKGKTGKKQRQFQHGEVQWWLLRLWSVRSRCSGGLSENTGMHKKEFMLLAAKVVLRRTRGHFMLTAALKVEYLDGSSERNRER